MTTATYSNEHIAQVSRKLQKDVNSILEDILEYFPDYKDGRQSRVDLDVDLVLRIHALQKQARLNSHYHTQSHSTHSHLHASHNTIGTYVPYSNQEHSHEKKSFGIGRIWK